MDPVVSATAIATASRPRGIPFSAWSSSSVRARNKVPFTDVGQRTLYHGAAESVDPGDYLPLIGVSHAVADTTVRRSRLQMRAQLGRSRRRDLPSTRADQSSPSEWSESND